MRLTVITEELHPFAGLQRSAIELTEGLAWRGHVVSLVYQRPGDLSLRYRKATDRQIVVKTRLTVDPEHRVRSSAQLLLARARLGFPPAATYVHTVSHALFGRLVAGPRRPVVCHLRVPPEARFAGAGKRAMVKAVTRFVAVSHHTKTLYVTAGIPADRIDVVHNGVDLDHYKRDEAAGLSLRHTLGIGADVPVVAYAGRLDPVKGVDHLLIAHQLLPPDTVLVVAGAPRAHRSPAEARKHLSMLRGLAADDRVRWLGFVDDVRPLLSAADASVLPSTWPEPSGRAVLESMACGCPVVASDVGGVAEQLVGFERGLVPPGDPAALAAAIEPLLHWRRDAPALGAEYRQHVADNFTLDRTLDGVEDVLQRADANHRGPRRTTPDGRR